MLQFQHGTRMAGCQHLPDWEGHDECDRTFTADIDHCAEKVAYFHVLMFIKKIN